MRNSFHSFNFKHDSLSSTLVEEKNSSSFKADESLTDEFQNVIINDSTSQISQFPTDQNHDSSENLNELNLINQDMSVNWRKRLRKFLDDDNRLSGSQNFSRERSNLQIKKTSSDLHQSKGSQSFSIRKNHNRKPPAMNSFSEIRSDLEIRKRELFSNRLNVASSFPLLPQVRTELKQKESNFKQQTKIHSSHLFSDHEELPSLLPVFRNSNFDLQNEFTEYDFPQKLHLSELDRNSQNLESYSNTRSTRRRRSNHSNINQINENQIEENDLISKTNEITFKERKPEKIYQTNENELTPKSNEIISKKDNFELSHKNHLYENENDELNSFYSVLRNSNSDLQNEFAEFWFSPKTSSFRIR